MTLEKAFPLWLGYRLAGILLLMYAFSGWAADASGIGVFSPRVVTVHLFWAKGCPHCERERRFLAQLAARDARVRVQEYELTDDSDKRVLLQEFGAALGLVDVSVPLTVIGGRVNVGYQSDETTGALLSQWVDQCLREGCTDALHQWRQSGMVNVSGVVAPTASSRIELPWVGVVDASLLSLPVLTVVLAALDGFNPCAMWTLVFLIGLLVGLPDRRRRWWLGTAFIAGSALVYFLFMAAWLNALLFIGAVVWVRALIGLLALAGGVYYLRRFFSREPETCQVTAPAQRRRVFERLRELVRRDSLWLATAGILLLAFAVNLVELICSAGIPAVYTQVLSMHALSRPAYYAWLVLYVFVFMLDDLVVFYTAMRTLEVTGLTGRYTRASRLFGGVLLLVLGLLLLARPEWLMGG